MEYHFSFHFPPSIALDRFYDECHRLIRTLFEAGIYTGTFYSGGRSLKDALSRPIDLTTPEAFKARMKEGEFRLFPGTELAGLLLGPQIRCEH